MNQLLSDSEHYQLAARALRCLCFSHLNLEIVYSLFTFTPVTSATCPTATKYKIKSILVRFYIQVRLVRYENRPMWWLIEMAASSKSSFSNRLKQTLGKQFNYSPEIGPIQLKSNVGRLNGLLIGL